VKLGFLGLRHLPPLCCDQPNLGRAAVWRLFARTVAKIYSFIGSISP
jgi:hypothetical protein